MLAFFVQRLSLNTCLRFVILRIVTRVTTTLMPRSPLHYAVQGGLTRIVQCLLEYDTYMEGRQK